MYTFLLVGILVGAAVLWYATYKLFSPVIDTRIDVIDDLPFKSDSFARMWKSMEEWRRRGNIGLFVQVYGREPTEEEILTGDIR
jgi:hypothetical protein